jgi:deoxyhypusine synthase
MDSKNEAIPDETRAAVLTSSSSLPGYDEQVKGYDWSKGNDLNGILNSYKTTGFQATNFGLAVDEINEMVRQHTIIRRY